ncbi:hypothetical protein HDU96_004630, partial [Phlyctochytrium bullatum]
MQNLGTRNMPILTYSTLRNAKMTQTTQAWMLKFLRHVDAHALVIKAAEYGTKATKTTPLSKHLEEPVENGPLEHQNNILGAERALIHNLMAQHVDDDTYTAYENAIQTTDTLLPHHGWLELLKMAKLDKEHVLMNTKSRLNTLHQGDATLTDYLATARAISTAIIKHKLHDRGIDKSTLAKNFCDGLNATLKDALFTTFQFSEPKLKTDWTVCEAFFREYAQTHDDATKASETALQTALLSAHRSSAPLLPAAPMTRAIDPQSGFHPGHPPPKPAPTPAPNPQGLPCPRCKSTSLTHRHAD